MVPTVPYCMTASGKEFAFENPNPGALDIGDIAAALSRTCRFGGHLSSRWDDHIYSVAQHSVYVWMLLDKFAQHRSQFWGLMHDALEAYYGDTIDPLKRMFPGLILLEERAQPMLRMQWGIPFNDQIADEVHWADRAIGCAEAFILKEPGQAEIMYKVSSPPLSLTDLDPDFRPWSPREARLRFLNAYGQQKTTTIEQDNPRANSH